MLISNTRTLEKKSSFPGADVINCTLIFSFFPSIVARAMTIAFVVCVRVFFLLPQVGKKGLFQVSSEIDDEDHFCLILFEEIINNFLFHDYFSSRSSHFPTTPEQFAEC